MRLSTILCTCVLAGWSVAAAAQEQVVNLYSASQEHLLRPTLEKFTEETGIKVNVTSLPGPAMTTRVEMEGKDTPADILVNADIGNLYQLKTKGLLQPVESEVIEKNIPAELRSPDKDWVGVAMRARLIFYRKADGKPDIEHYIDLADDKYKDGVLVRSSTNVYNQSLLSDIILRTDKETGQQWANGVAANLARKPEGGDRDQLRALASGVGTVAMSNSYYYGLLQTSEDPADRAAAEKLAFIVPKGVSEKDDLGVHVNIRAAAMTKYAKHPEAAKKLLEFLTTEPAQRFFTDHNKEFTANPAVEQSDTVKAFNLSPLPKVSLDEIGAMIPQTIPMFDAADWP